VGEALSAGTVSVGVKPETKGFGAKLAEGIRGESGGIAGLGSELGGKLLAGLGAIGIAVGVGEFIKKGIEEYSTADALNAQFAAGITSTNNAANLSVKGMDQLAASIAGYSGQSYASIGKTEQVLQTFTNLRNVGPNKIFDEATTAAANMAAKLGGDASASAIQLGKALNDPVKGMTALRRVGVAFTQAQTDQVKAMVKSGDVMGAQKVILGELNTEFGGAAKAAGETLPGEIARSKVAFGELTKAVVGGVMPFVTPVIAGIANAMVALTPHVEALAEVVKSKLEPVFSAVSNAFKDVIAGFKVGTDTLGSSQSVFAVFGASLYTVFQSFKPVIDSVVSAFKALAPQFAPLIPQVLQLASSFSPFGLVLHALLPVLPQMIGAIVPLVGILGGALAGVFQTLLPVITSVVKILTGDLANVFATLVPIIANIAQVLGQVLGAAFKELAPVITLVAAFMAQLMKAVMPIVPVVMQLVEAILPLIAPMLQLAGQILGVVISLFMQLLPPIMDLVRSLVTMLMPVITVLIQALAQILPPVLKALMPIISAVASIFGDILGPAIKAITSVLGGIIDFLTGVFTGNWNKVWRGISEIFSGIWNGLIGIVRGVVNGIIDAIDGVIRGVNSVGGAVGIHIGVIPHLADSGTVLPTPGGTIVRVAEGGKAESVVDTGKLNSLMDAASSNAKRGGDTFNIYETVSAQATAAQVARRQVAFAV
jgi:hypothetical protein